MIKKVLFRLFGGTKTQSLIRILSYIFNQSESIPLSKIKSKFQYDYKSINKVLEGLNYLTIVNKTTNNVTEKHIHVKNYNELLRDIQALNNLVQEKNHKVTQIVLGAYSLLITLFAIMLSIMQFSASSTIGAEQLKYIKLDSVAEVELVYSPSNFTANMTETTLCFSNRGGIETGDITLNFEINNSTQFQKKISSIAPKQVSCFNQIFNQGFDKMLNLSVEYSCLTCTQKKSATLIKTD